MIKPTSKLRFIERSIPVPEHGENISKRVRILQQWWEDEYNYDSITGKFYGEWRDVPLEEL